MTPFKGTNRITSPFGPRRSPISGRQEQHKGDDSVTTGPWPGKDWHVRECTGGRVLRVTSDQWRGNYVDVETEPGTFERCQHMHEIYVKSGQIVPQGTVLGMAGKTGDSTGVHLHFEVQKNGVAVNPSAWSGVPSTIGTYAGNDSLDGAPSVPQETPETPEPEQEIAPQSGGETMLTVFTPKTEDLELFTAPDVTATVPGTERSTRLPVSSYVVYDMAPLANIANTAGVRIAVGGVFYWVAKLPGQYLLGTMSLQRAEEKEMLGGHTPPMESIELHENLNDAEVSAEAAMASVAWVLENLKKAKKAAGA